ncbi:MAG: phospholipid carrier-dependent glycosyltransferase [Candidatus Yanofskybacteria bacterium]|nr:phospholipid carrier-dependent glycosyltransferase [Candidatus Yanofskybacteria bacterium]
MSNKKSIFIILALSFATHLAFFGHPNETVFDEVHFGKFVSGYYTGEYYFDIHPPLGKLIIAGFAKIVDFKSEYNFTEIGKEFPDNKYLALRFLPAIAGTLLPLIIFLLTLELGISRMAAFAGGLLLIFENSLLTQSRLMLLDQFLLLFGFTSLLFYFKYHNQSNIRYLILQSSPDPAKLGQETIPRKNVGMFSVFWKWNSNLFFMAVFAGLAVSIKWTGLSFIALPILIEVAKTLKIPETLKTAIKLTIVSFMAVLRMASFFLISFIIYFLVFALHFALLPNPGLGDAFMKPNFRENNIVKNIWDLNTEMYKSNQRLMASHPYSSQFYTWPLMARPIFYWVKDNARIYFFGNPVVWWSSTIAVIYFMFDFFRNKKNYTYWLLVIGYWLNLLPFIGVKRVMFLYHYLTALIFAILILVYLIDPERTNGHDKSRPTSYGASKIKKRLLAGLVIASIAAFLFFAPLSYGLPLSEKAYNARIWFASWR